MLGKLTFFGPHIWNFSEVADVLTNEKCGIKVNSQDELFSSMFFYFSNCNMANEMGKRAKEKMYKFKGATEKIIDAIKNHSTVSD
jgi:3-deoxy-D-manno-octulosonic-acid transferase